MIATERTVDRAGLPSLRVLSFGDTMPVHGEGGSSYRAEPNMTAAKKRAEELVESDLAAFRESERKRVADYRKRKKKQVGETMAKLGMRADGRTIDVDASPQTREERMAVLGVRITAAAEAFKRDPSAAAQRVVELTMAAYLSEARS